MSEITAAILVGGKARRFNGELKPALKIGDQTILERQLQALDGAGMSEVLLVGRWPAPQVAGARHFPDLVEESGPLGGLYSALLLSTTPIVVVLAGDLPFVAPPLLRALVGLRPEDDAIVPRTSAGWHPLCAAYRRRVAPAVKARLDRGALRVSDALSDMRVRELTTEALARLDGDGMLMNVNTPDDHTRARHRAGVRS